MAAQELPQELHYVSTARVRRQQLASRRGASDAASEDGSFTGTLARLPAETIGRFLSFLSFRDRCRFVRPVARAWDAACEAEPIWVHLCHDRGIRGTVVAVVPSHVAAAANGTRNGITLPTEGESSLPESQPHLYYPTLLGAHASGVEQLLPVQLAVQAWEFAQPLPKAEGAGGAAEEGGTAEGEVVVTWSGPRVITRCSHMNERFVEAYIRRGLGSLHRRFVCRRPLSGSPADGTTTAKSSRDFLLQPESIDWVRYPYEPSNPFERDELPATKQSTNASTSTFTNTNVACDQHSAAATVITDGVTTCEADGTITFATEIPAVSPFCSRCRRSLSRRRTRRPDEEDLAALKYSRPLPDPLRNVFRHDGNAHQSASHAALFMRCECPHLDERMLQTFEWLWEDRGRRIVETNCQHRKATVPPRPPNCGAASAAAEPVFTARRVGYRVTNRVIDVDRDVQSKRYAMWEGVGGGCNNRSTYVCLHCGMVMCGIGAGECAAGNKGPNESTGHMHNHALTTGHVLVMGVRSLSVYCFACDRFLGYGGTLEDVDMTRRLRAIVTQQPLIWHHRAGVHDWSFAPIPSSTCGRR